MKSVVMVIWILLFMITAAYSAPKPPLQVTAQNVIGEWTLQYSLENGRSNSDPRWALRIILQKDGKFICDSISTQEEWLQNVKTGQRTTKAIETKTHLEGIYRLEGDKAFFTFTKDLNVEEQEFSRVNLGYDSQRKDAVVRISLQKEDHPLTGDSVVLLSMQGLNTTRLLFFTEKNKANAGPSEPNAL
ncbi:MAG: hypothetical protein HQL22_03435 [Candidatus Omnitrophica bacterium]|nr:hypothetical protein [Candidatus Omnitrophota bacterium]